MAKLLKLYKENARKASHNYTFKLESINNFCSFYVNSSSDPWKCLLLGSADLLSIVDCGKIFSLLSVFNKLGSYYNVGRRSRKRWKRVFAYGIECSVSNAYVLDKFAKPIEHARSGISKRD